MAEANDPLKESPLPLDCELPVAPDWFSHPPAGTMEDGIVLSLEAWKAAETRAAAIFAERDRRRCDVEFRW